MVDFFEEVEEDLRADRLRRLSKHLPVVSAVVGVGFAIALGVTGYFYWADTQVSQASIAYEKGLRAAQAGDMAGAQHAFTDAQKPMASGYKTLGLMQQAGLAGAQGHDADAAKLLDQASSAAGSNRILADLASLLAAYRVMDTASYPDIEKRLKPLTEAGRPFHAAALEALAMAQLKAGKVREAKADFSALGLMLDAPADMRQRAQIALQALDSGEAARAVEIANSAATLPTPSASPQAPSAGSPVPQAGAAQ